MDENNITYELVYPQVNQKIPKGMPSTIEKAYRIADRIKAIDIDIYTISLRKILELVCIDKHAKSGTLNEMLQDLANKNEIPNKLVMIASHLKSFGNIGTHPLAGRLSKNEFPIIKSLIDSILAYLYEAPYLASIAEQN